jgi:transposase InsO family protein
MKASLAGTAARNAIGQRDIEDTILHSDRGSQFRSNTFVRVLKNNGITGPMGRVGACGDNAAMESVLRTVAEERPRPATLVHARRTAPRDRRLDRANLPPQAPTTPSRQAHPDRI